MSHTKPTRASLNIFFQIPMNALPPAKFVIRTPPVGSLMYHMFAPVSLDSLEMEKHVLVRNSHVVNMVIFKISLKTFTFCNVLFSM